MCSVYLLFSYTYTCTPCMCYCAQVILATKAASVMPGMDRSYIVANRSDPPADTDEQPCLTRNQILSACDASLRRLRTNYIDLYQLHVRAGDLVVVMLCLATNWLLRCCVVLLF